MQPRSQHSGPRSSADHALFFERRKPPSIPRISHLGYRVPAPFKGSAHPPGSSDAANLARRGNKAWTRAIGTRWQVQISCPSAGPDCLFCHFFNSIHTTPPLGGAPCEELPRIANGRVQRVTLKHSLKKSRNHPVTSAFRGNGLFKRRLVRYSGAGTGGDRRHSIRTMDEGLNPRSAALPLRARAALALFRLRISRVSSRGLPPLPKPSIRTLRV